MKNIKNYTLIFLIILSAVAFSILGHYWNIQYYQSENTYTLSAPPLATAMKGIHDKLYFADYSSFFAGYAVNNLNILAASASVEPETEISPQFSSDIAAGILELPAEKNAQTAILPDKPQTYDFTTATDEYFQDACFIGDSRTVGISAYSGIENAVFLCKTSLSIYDYEKPKVTYNDEKKSVRDVLTEQQFGKIYLMVGINECGTGTAQSFFEHYRDVVNDIRKLQPDALIFIQGNLFITEQKSSEGTAITNENIAERNALIATLANQKDIFYIDINESSLCEEGALVPDYTWDQVHIKAQYYPIWKDFLLNHAIIQPKNEMEG
ncbi:MAG: hypothetical protein K2N73_02650 [Lachnospiraceae bacterium]|nr:hypothetical protein [Lachnospiraceae bacterium]